jgi:hypothetical protein
MPPGYPQYAAFIATDPDGSTTVYRRFDRLAARNLLYLESELADLEVKQNQLDAELSNRGTIAVLNELNLLEIEGKERLDEVPPKAAGRPGFVSSIDKHDTSAQIAEYAHFRKERLEVAKFIRAALKEYCMTLLSANLITRAKN